MKIFKNIFLVLVIILSFSYYTDSFWESFTDLFNSKSSNVIYCSWDECGLDSWMQAVRDWVDWIEKDRKVSTYIQDIIKYLMTFITIIAVLYIIYAWFKILTSAWEEETQKSQKKTIISVAIWIIIIWLAYSIVDFVIRIIA